MVQFFSADKALYKYPKTGFLDMEVGTRMAIANKCQGVMTTLPF